MKANKRQVIKLDLHCGQLFSCPNCLSVCLFFVLAECLNQGFSFVAKAGKFMVNQLLVNHPYSFTWAMLPGHSLQTAPSPSLESTTTFESVKLS